MSGNLQRCLHCGSKAVLVEERHDEYNCSLWAIHCNGCPVQTDLGSDRAAITESWNRSYAPRDIRKKPKKAVVS